MRRCCCSSGGRSAAVVAPTPDLQHWLAPTTMACAYYGFMGPLSYETATQESVQEPGKEIAGERSGSERSALYRSFARRSWVEISLRQIVQNFRAVRDVVGGGVEVMPVVKADAYRHGAVEVSRALAAAGARWLAVSNVEEGVILRERGIETRILVMADFLPAERGALLDYNLTPVIHSLEDIAEWDRLASGRGVTG